MDAPAADEIRAEIAAGGPIPFQRFMHLALYGAGGFYASGGRAGRRGDFLTSPEVGPLFGAVVSRMLEAEWRRLGEPSDFTVVEVGAGPGTLARSITAAAGPWLSRYVAVEVAESQRELHPQGLESRSSLPEERVTGVVLANELLDNVPFGLLVFDGAWREAFVDVRGDRFVEVLSPRPFCDATEPTVGSVASQNWLPAHAPHGARVPVQESSAELLQSLRSVVEIGRVVSFDYVVGHTVLLADRPWREWLRTYRGHQRGVHYLADPGSQDITVEVCLDQYSEPDALRTQAQFLQRWGIDELVEEGRQAWAAAAANPTLASLRMRSRVREAEALCDPSGLGAFTVAEWAV